MTMRHGHDMARQLHRYSAGANVVLAKARCLPATERWTAYTAALGAALSLAPALEAVPIYSGLQDIELSGISTYLIDMDRNGVPDFVARMYQEFIPQTAHAYLGATNNYAPGNGVLVDGSILRKLAPGAVISSLAGSFAEGRGEMVQNGSPLGAWLPSQTGFAGVRFGKDGNDHFGWVRLHFRMDVDPDPYLTFLSITVKDWAYESVAGAPIEAGAGLSDVPEPSALALLATGAAGVLAWRRQRRSRAAS